MKQKGRPINLNYAANFKNMLDYCALVDLGFSGPKFTWPRMCRNCNFIQQRLGRIVANPEWILNFPNAKVVHFTRLKSDHCPIFLLLKPVGLDRNVRPFTCEPMWLDHPDF